MIQPRPALPPQAAKNHTPKPKQVCFSSAKVLREFRETFAEEFCNLDKSSGLPTLRISAMILVAL